MGEASLVKIDDVAGFSKPATVLIKKISDAIGTLYEPRKIRNLAKARSTARLIEAETNIKVDELQRRAIRRFLSEEAKKQENIESITEKALPQLGEGASPENIEDDWITNFFERCRILSDSEMQQLWSRLLAGEANQPGTFSRRTVNLLSDLDKLDAELFKNLCSFAWMMGEPVPLIFKLPTDYRYEALGISFESLSHLESLGLIHFDNVTGYLRVDLPQRFHISYFGRTVELTIPEGRPNQLQFGAVMLTQAGRELARISNATPTEGFFEYVCTRWASQSIEVRPVGDTHPGTPGEGPS
jgi:hypothetical protein